jgi:hypothetical protein
MNLDVLAWSLGAVRTWVLFYTAGLPREARLARGDEIASDLWEQTALAAVEGQPPARTARSLLGRCLRGMPADLFWRLNLKGEPKMLSRGFVVRSAGFAMLAILGLVAGMAVTDYGIGSEEQYFRDEFPAFARSTDERGLGLVFGGILALVGIIGAGALLQTFRPYQPWLASIGAATLMLAGVLLVASVTAGLALVDLAEEWTARGAVAGDGVWVSARRVAEIYEGMGFLALMLIVASLASFGTLVIWKGPLPRWVGSLGMVSGGLLLLALVTLALSIGVGWFILMASMVCGALWLAVTGSWLILKGTYQLRDPVPA